MAFIDPYKNREYTLQEYARAMERGQEAKEEISEEKNVLLGAVDTAVDLGGNVLEGAGRSIEGIFDMVAGVVGGVGGLISKDFQEGVQDVIEFDVTDWAGNEIFNRAHRMLTGRDIAEDSYLKDGGMIEQVLQGVGGMLPAVAVSVATGGAGAPAAVSQALSTATMAAGAAGQSMQEAYQDGADYYQGLAYGAIRGGTEVVTEKLFGGLDAGLFGKGLLPPVAKSVADTGVKRFVKGALQEGAEEMVSEWLDPAARSVYQGKEVYKKYLDPAFYGDVWDAGVAGTLTGAAFSGTVGRALSGGSLSEDLNAIEEQVTALENKKANLEAAGKLTAEAEAAIDESIRENYRLAESVLKAAKEGKRKTALERSTLGGDFEADGSLKAEKSALLDAFAEGRRLSVSPAEGGQGGNTAALDGRYVSHRVTGDRAVKALKNGGAHALTRELSEAESKEYAKLRRAMRTLDVASGNKLDYVLAEGMADKNAYFDPDTGVVVIGADTLTADAEGAAIKAWGQALVHEVTHTTEGTMGNAALAAQLSSIMEDEALYGELSRRGYFKGRAEEVKAHLESILAKDAKGTETSSTASGPPSPEGKVSEELTESEIEDLETFVSEGTAIMAEKILGDGHFIRRLVVEQGSVAEKVLVKLTELKESLSRMTSRDAKSLHRAVVKAEGLYLKAVEEAGYRFEGGKFVGSEEDEEKVKYSRVIRDVIQKAIDNKGDIGEEYNQKRFSSVPRKLSEMVEVASAGKIDISGKHLALNGDDIWHEYQRHSNPEIEAGRRQIPLTQETMKEAIEAIYAPDIVECVFADGNNPSQRRSFAYSKKTADGHYVVVEVIGGRKNPNITPVMVIHVNQKKWDAWKDKTLGEMLYEHDKRLLDALDVPFNKKNRVTVAQFVSEETIANTPHSPQFNNSISQDGDSVKRDFSEGKVKESRKPKSQTSGDSEAPIEYQLPEDPRALELRGDQRKALANWSRNKVYDRKDAMEIVDAIIGIIEEQAEQNSVEGKEIHKGKILRKLREKNIDQLFADLNTAATPTQREAVAQRLAEALVAETRVDILLTEEVIAEELDWRMALQQYMGMVDVSAIEQEAKEAFGKRSRDISKWRAKEEGHGMTPEEVKKELESKAGAVVPAEDALGILMWLNDEFNDVTSRLMGQGRYLLKDSLEGEAYENTVDELTQELLELFDEKGHPSAKAAMQAEHQRQQKKLREQKNKQLEGQKQYYQGQLERKEDYFQGRLDSQEQYFRGRLDRKEMYFQKRILKMKNASDAQIAWLRDKNSDLRADLRESNQMGRLLNRLQYELNRFRDWKSGRFLNATQYKDGKSIVETTIGKLTKMTNRGNLILKVDSVRKAMLDLWLWYQSIHAEKNELGFVFDQHTVDHMQEIAYGDGKLTALEIKHLTDIIVHVKHVAENYQKFWKNGKLVDALPEARKYCVQIEANKDFRSKVLDFIFTHYGKEFGEPAALFRYIDGYRPGFLSDFFERFRKDDIQAQYIEHELTAERRAFLKKNRNYLKKAMERTVTYVDGKGQRFEMPALLAVELYMSTKSEENAAMLAVSGFGYTDPKTGKPVRPEGFMQGEQPYYTEKGPLYGKIRPEVLEMAKVKCDELYRQFSDNDKAYIEAVEKGYELSATEKAKMDIKRTGRANVMAGYYHPAAISYKAETIDENGYLMAEMNRVSAQSFNKHRTEGNKHELWIDDADTVFMRHARGVAKYSAMGLDIDAYNMLLNMEVLDNANKPTNVASQLDKVFPGGRDARRKFMRSFFDDLQGMSGGDTGGFGRVLEKIRGNYAVSVITLNAKVWLSQFSSYFAAANVVSPLSLVKGFNLTIGKDVDKYSALAMLRHEDNEAAMAQGVLDSLDGVKEVLAKPIGGNDRMVVKRIFAACQYEVEKNGGGKVGTEENKVKAGELLEKVILETQQSSLMTEKSAAMRSKNPLLRTFTMFSADSMKQLARLADGIGEVTMLRREAKRFGKDFDNARLKAAWKKTARAASVITVQAIYMVAIAWAIGKLLKKDDEDETALDVMVGLATDFFGNILGGLPVLRDIYDMMTQGYGVEDMSLSAFNDLVSSVKDLIDASNALATGDLDGREAAAKVRKTMFAVGRIMGVPLQNFYNYTRAAVHWISPDSGYKLDDFFYKQSYNADIKAAIEAEDEDRLSTIVGVMLDENVGEVKSSVVRQEMNRLVVAGMDVLPRGVGDVITYEGQSVKLTAKQKAQFRKVYGEANEAVSRMVSMKLYTGADDEAKAKAIKRLYGIYYNRAIEDLLGVDIENKNVLMSRAVDPAQLSIIAAVCAGLGADVGKDGKAISGSKKAKVISYLSALNLKAAQKHLILGYLGYKNAQGEEKVRAYLAGLGLGREEVKELLEIGGY